MKRKTFLALATATVLIATGLILAWPERYQKPELPTPPPDLQAIAQEALGASYQPDWVWAIWDITERPGVAAQLHITEASWIVGQPWPKKGGPIPGGGGNVMISKQDRRVILVYGDQ